MTITDTGVLVRPCFYLYRLVYPLALLLLAPWRYKKNLGRPRFSFAFWQRLGFYSRPDTHHPIIWIHAASVGEARLALNLLRTWPTDTPHHFMISTFTTTGYKVLSESVSQSNLQARVSIRFVPYDLTWSVRRAFKIISPKLIVLIESDFWPEFLVQARDLHIPVWVANARLSERSYKALLSYKTIASWLLNLTQGMLISSERTRLQLNTLNYQGSVHYHGSLKTHVQMHEGLGPIERLQRLQTLGLNVSHSPLVVMGVSTWPGEESMLLEALQDFTSPIVLILAPRHVERKPKLAKIFSEKPYPVSWFSSANNTSSQTLSSSSDSATSPLRQILMIDQTGVLDQIYPLVDLAIMGKSFLNHWGGQNPIEPISYGIATIIGSQHCNFQPLIESMLEAKAIEVADDAETLKTLLSDLLNNPEARQTLAQSGQQWLKQQQAKVQEAISQLNTLTHQSSTSEH